jgi:hypothetical protein
VRMSEESVPRAQARWDTDCHYEITVSNDDQRTSSLQYVHGSRDVLRTNVSISSLAHQWKQCSSPVFTV